MVIFALNDNPDPTIAEGGCHWSLVAYSRSASPRTSCISRSNFPLFLSYYVDI